MANFEKPSNKETSVNPHANDNFEPLVDNISSINSQRSVSRSVDALVKAPNPKVRRAIIKDLQQGKGNASVVNVVNDYTRISRQTSNTPSQSTTNLPLIQRTPATPEQMNTDFDELKNLSGRDYEQQLAITDIYELNMPGGNGRTTIPGPVGGPTSYHIADQTDNRKAFLLVPDGPDDEGNKVPSRIVFVGTEMDAGEKRKNADFRADTDVDGVGSHQYQSMKPALERMLKEAGGKVDVVGHSLGGANSQNMVADYPDKVTSLEIFDAPGISNQRADKFRQDQAKLPKEEQIDITDYHVGGLYHDFIIASYGDHGGDFVSTSGQKHLSKIGFELDDPKKPTHDGFDFISAKLGEHGKKLMGPTVEERVIDNDKRQSDINEFFRRSVGLPDSTITMLNEITKIASKQPKDMELHKQNIKNIFEKINQSVDKAKQFGINIWNTGVQIVKGIKNGIENIGKGIASGVTLVKNVFSNVGNAITSALSKIGDAVVGAVSGIANAVSGNQDKEAKWATMERDLQALVDQAQKRFQTVQLEAHARVEQAQTKLEAAQQDAQGKIERGNETCNNTQQKAESNMEQAQNKFKATQEKTQHNMEQAQNRFKTTQQKAQTGIQKTELGFKATQQKLRANDLKNTASYKKAEASGRKNLRGVASQFQSTKKKLTTSYKAVAKSVDSARQRLLSLASTGQGKKQKPDKLKREKLIAAKKSYLQVKQTAGGKQQQIKTQAIAAQQQTKNKAEKVKATVTTSRNHFSAQQKQNQTAARGNEQRARKAVQQHKQTVQVAHQKAVQTNQQSRQTLQAAQQRHQQSIKQSEQTLKTSQHSTEQTHKQSEKMLHDVHQKTETLNQAAMVKVKAASQNLQSVTKQSHAQVEGQHAATQAVIQDATQKAHSAQQQLGG